MHRAYSQLFQKVYILRYKNDFEEHDQVSKPGNQSRSESPY